MPIHHQKEATLGMLTYLVIGAAVAVTFLLGTVVVSLEAVRDLLNGAALHDWIHDGSAFLTFAVAFLVVLPFVALTIAAMMGRRAAVTGNAVRKQAALTTLFGALIAWVSMALALLVASALVGRAGTAAAFAEVLDLVFESLFFLLLAIPPLLGLAALTAGYVRNAFTEGPLGFQVADPVVAGDTQGYDDRFFEDSAFASGDPYRPAEMFTMTSEPSAIAAHEGALRAGQGYVQDLPVDCPRCETHFLIDGVRPIRITCPGCGKQGTLH